MEHNANIAHYRHLIPESERDPEVTRIGTKHCGRCWPRKLPSKDKKPFDLRLPTKRAVPLCVRSEARAQSRFSSPAGLCSRTPAKPVPLTKKLAADQSAFGSRAHHELCLICCYSLSPDGIKRSCLVARNYFGR